MDSNNKQRFTQIVRMRVKIYIEQCYFYRKKYMEQCESESKL